MPSYPAGMTVSNRALIMLSDALRKNRATLGTRWRRLNPGQQALLVVAHLRKGETSPRSGYRVRDRHDDGVPLHPRGPRRPRRLGSNPQSGRSRPPGARRSNTGAP